METLFGEVAVKDEEKALVTTTIEVESQCTGNTESAYHHTAECPFCHKDAEVTVFQDGEYVSSECCIHFSGTYKFRDGRVRGLKFSGKRKHIAVLRGEVEWIEMADVTCPYCKYVERVDEYELPSRDDSLFQCSCCKEKFLI